MCEKERERGLRENIIVSNVVEKISSREITLVCRHIASSFSVSTSGTEWWAGTYFYGNENNNKVSLSPYNLTQ